MIKLEIKARRGVRVEIACVYVGSQSSLINLFKEDKGGKDEFKKK
jgi:hypothetical protein